MSDLTKGVTLNAAHPHLVAETARTAQERIRRFGVNTGDVQTARAYERLVTEDG